MGIRLLLEGYEFGEKITKDPSCYFVKAKRISDDQSVLVKVAHDPGMDAELRREFELIERFESSVFLQPLEMTQIENRRATIFEDFDGKALDEWVTSQPIEIETFLKWAIEIARQMKSMHEMGIIHRNISTENILLNPNTLQVCFMGLYAPLIEPEETQHIILGIPFYQHLSYLAPEQTGFYRHQIDYRTDYYLLGAVLYDLLTGHPPFQSNDAHRLIRRVVTMKPVPPSDLKCAPKMVSDIVMKLVEKCPEHRYQTAKGLIDDLTHCLEMLHTEGDISLFPLATTDIREHFYVSQKGYGRQVELTFLKSSLDSVVKGNKKVIVIQGEKGVGKSNLLASLYEDILKVDLPLAQGRFDRLLTHQSYSAFTEAFDQLIWGFAQSPFERFNLYRQQFDELMGNSQAALIKVLPALKGFYEEDGQLESLDGLGQQRRFFAAWSRLIKAITTVNGGFVCFLENIDDIDAASARLLTNLIDEPELTHFLLIVTCRQPIETLLRSMRSMRSEVFCESLLAKEDQSLNFATHLMKLNAFTLDSVDTLVADTITLNRTQHTDLVKALYQRTQGYPKKVVALLHQLYRQKMILFDQELGQWMVDFEKLHHLTDEQVTYQSILAVKLKELSSETLEILRAAACIGRRFSLKLLSAVFGWDQETVFNLLRPAVFHHILMVIKDNELHSDYLFLKTEEAELLSDQLSLEKRQQYHRNIAKKLISTRCEDLLAVVNHVVLAGPHWPVQNPVVFAELCCSAAKEAIEVAAYELAIEMCRDALQRLENDSESNQQALILQLHMLSYEAAFLSDQPALAKTFLDHINTSVIPQKDWFALCLLRLAECRYLKDFDQLTLLGTDILQQLGIPIPSQTVLLEEAEKAYEKAFGQITDTALEKLTHTPLTEDPTLLFIVRVYAELCRPVLRLDHQLHCYLTTSGYNLCFETGLVRGTDRILAEFAFLCANRHALDKAWSLFRFGLNVTDKPHFLKNRLIVCALYSTDHWKRPLSSPFGLLPHIELASLSEGDPTTIGMAYLAISNILLGLSVSVPETLSLLERALLFVEPTLHPVTYPCLLLLREMYQYLDSPLIALKDIEEDALLVLEDGKDCLTVDGERYKGLDILHSWILKAYLLSLSGQFNAAFKWYQRADQHIEVLGSLWLIVEHHFFYATTAAHLLIRTDDVAEKAHYQSIIRQCLDQFDQWRRGCPENFEGQYLLLQVVNRLSAFSLQDIFYTWRRAQQSAFTQQCLKEKAAIEEILSHYLVVNGLSLYGFTHLIGAIDAYKNWQASSKDKALTEEFHQTMVQNATLVSSSFSHILDMTVAEALVDMARQLFEENNASQLMPLLADMLAYYGHATLVFLALREEDQLVLEALSGQQLTHYENMQGKSLEALPPGQFPKHLMLMTKRLKQTFSWPQVAAEIPAEAYIHAANPASAICMPLLDKEDLMGVVYFENRHLSDVYSKDRRHLLNKLMLMATLLIKNYLRTQRYQRSIIDLEERFSESSAGLSVLVTGVAHEINTPIGNALTATTHLENEIIELQHAFEEGKLSKSRLGTSLDMVKKGVDIAVSNLKRAAQLVLTFKQVSIDQSREEKLQFDLGEYLQGLIEHLMPVLNKKAIQIKYLAPPHLMVDSYPESISQILTSLFMNAVTHAFEGRNKGMISIELKVQGKYVWLFFRDDGKGMTPEVRARIFDPFTTTKRGRGGSGLGAHIMYNLITQRLGGQVKCQSELNKGTEFIIQIPLESPT